MDVADPTVGGARQGRGVGVKAWANNNPAWVHAAVIFGVTVLAFANSIFNSFHLDDFYRVAGNPGIQQISRPWVHFVEPRTMSTLPRISGFRPLLPLSLSINYAMHGERVAGYHVFNIFTQGLAAWLVYLLVLELLALAAPARLEPTRFSKVALWVALVFAVHPVGGIAVNYICARDQLMMQVFLGAALVLYLRQRRTRFTPAGWAAVMVLVLLSLLSKGDGVVAPALVVVLETTVGRARWTQASTYLRAVPFVLPVLALFAYSRWVLGFSETENVINTRLASVWTYPLTQARLHLWRYLPQFFWPFSMRQDPLEPLANGVDLRVALGLVFIVASVLAAWWLRRRAPLVAFCIMAYWLMMATTSSVVPLHAAAVDYRPYPSSPYLLLLLALGVSTLPARVAGLVAVASVVWAGGASVVLNRTWRNEETLWRHAVEQGAGPLAHLNLAMATTNLAERQALLTEALRVAPDYILVLVNLGRTEVALGQKDQGMAHLGRALALSPQDGQVRFWYAVTLSELGQHQEAAAQSALAAQLDPHNAQYLHQAALDAQRMEDHVAALGFLARLKQLAPRYQDAGFLEGFSLQQLGRLPEAVTTYEAFLAYRPRHVQARFNLGFALLTSGQCAQAIGHFERVLEVDPDRAAAHLHLATCFNATAQPDRARPHQQAWDATQPAPVAR